MAKRQVQCAHCDHTFEIDEDFAGESLPCPSCKSLIALPPREDGEPGSRQKLALKRDEAISGSMKRCPLCDSSTAQEAVICLTCGYDWRTGRQQHAGIRPSASRLSRFLLMVGLAVAAGVAAYVYLQKQAAPEAVPPPPEVPAVTLPAPVEPPPAGADQGVAAAPPTGPDAPAADEPVTAREAELAAEAARLSVGVTRMMDMRAPMYERDSPVAFRMVNGIIHRGTYLGVKGDVAVLMQEDNMLEIPIEELDRETRMRCDRTYRERYIEFLVARRLRQASGAGDQTGF